MSRIAEEDASQTAWFLSILAGETETVRRGSVRGSHSAVLLQTVTKREMAAMRLEEIFYFMA